MSSFGLPIAEGNLPIALAITSFLSIFNTAQCYTSTYYNKQIYNQATTKFAEVTGLSCRTFGIWTLLSGIIRTYSVFYLNDVHVYRLCFATYVCAWLHFVSELMIFKTANLKGVIKAPLIVATTMGSWMWFSWNSYVQ